MGPQHQPPIGNGRSENSKCGFNRQLSTIDSVFTALDKTANQSFEPARELEDRTTHGAYHSHEDKVTIELALSRVPAQF